jgi:nucleoid-associated protein YgaU
MADIQKPKDRRSPPQNPSRAESGSLSAPGAEWGATPAKSGVRGEVKLALMLVMTLAGAFGYIVYRKFDALQQVAAAEAVDSLKFKPVESPGTPQPEEVDLSGPPDQDSEPLFADGAPSPTSDPFALSGTSPSPSADALPNEPRTLNIQTATLVTAAEDRTARTTGESPPWSPAPDTGRDGPPLGLFEPEPSISQPSPSQPLDAVAPTAAPAFPQEFPQTSAAPSEPLIAAARDPELAPTAARPAPADIPFEPVFSEPAPSYATETSPAVTPPAEALSASTTARLEEPLPFAAPPREAPATAVESVVPSAVRPEPSSLLWTPVAETPAPSPSPSPGPTAPPAIPTAPVAAVEPFVPQEFPAANSTLNRNLSGQPLTSAISTNSPAWSPEPAAARSFAAAPAATGGEQVYTIRPGDNYWSISRNLYGTPRYFDALTEYNRERVPDPSRMQPGSQLHAPPREVLEARYPQLCGIATAAATPRTPAQAQPVAERGQFSVGPGGQPLYRVGTGDTLTSIAQKHLGRASRWTQVYEMNLDVLPNADTLKPGTVLKLPLDASQVAVTPDAPASR